LKIRWFYRIQQPIAKGEQGENISKKFPRLLTFSTIHLNCSSTKRADETKSKKNNKVVQGSVNQTRLSTSARAVSASQRASFKGGESSSQTPTSITNDAGGGPSPRGSNGGGRGKGSTFGANVQPARSHQQEGNGAKRPRFGNGNVGASQDEELVQSRGTGLTNEGFQVVTGKNKRKRNVDVTTPGNATNTSGPVDTATGRYPPR